MTKLIVAYRNFANAPKMFTFCGYNVCVFCVGPRTAIISLWSIKWMVSLSDRVFTARYELNIHMWLRLRPPLFWDVTLRTFVVTYRRYSSWTAWPLKIEPIGYPETSVNSNLRCVTCQNNEDLIYTAAEAWNRAWFRLIPVFNGMSALGVTSSIFIRIDPHWLQI